MMMQRRIQIHTYDFLLDNAHGRIELQSRAESDGEPDDELIIAGGEFQVCAGLAAARPTSALHLRRPAAAQATLQHVLAVQRAATHAAREYRASPRPILAGGDQRHSGLTLVDRHGANDGYHVYESDTPTETRSRVWSQMRARLMPCLAACRWRPGLRPDARSAGHATGDLGGCRPRRPRPGP